MKAGHYTQRDMMRTLLTDFGYNENIVCAAYAQAERDGFVQRFRNATGFTPEGYAAVVWRDGHRRSGPWILEFCRGHGIEINREGSGAAGADAADLPPRLHRRRGRPRRDEHFAQVIGNAAKKAIRRCWNCGKKLSRWIDDPRFGSRLSGQRHFCSPRCGFAYYAKRRTGADLRDVIDDDLVGPARRLPDDDEISN
jgi:hypothetical protein